MNIGEKYSLRWKLPHRIECEITALEQGRVVVNAVHRCHPPCALMALRETLPIEGVMSYRYHDFALLFVRINPDAIALPA